MERAICRYKQDAPQQSTVSLFLSQRISPHSVGYQLTIQPMPLAVCKPSMLLQHIAYSLICAWFFVAFPAIDAQQAGTPAQVVSIFPNFGSFDGSTSVTVTGSGFMNSWTLCKFGSIAQLVASRNPSCMSRAALIPLQGVRTVCVLDLCGVPFARFRLCRRFRRARGVYRWRLYLDRRQSPLCVFT